MTYSAVTRVAGWLTRVPRTLALASAGVLAACSSDAPSAPATLSPAAALSSVSADASGDSTLGQPILTAASTPAPFVSATGLGCMTSPASTSWGTDSIRPCVAGQANQQFVLNAAVGVKGKITFYNGVRCLTGFNAGVSPNPVGAYGCQTGWTTQEWTFTTAGELKLSTGYCATVITTTNPAHVALRTCDGSASQRWSQTLPGAPAPAPAPAPVAMDTGVVVLLNGLDGRPCLASDDTTGTQAAGLTVSWCTSGSHERFRLPAAGTVGPIRLGAALCVDVWNTGTSGDSLALRACNGSARQNWAVQSNGTIKGGPANFCMTAASAYAKARITYWGCGTAVKQRWTARSAGPLPTPLPVSAKLAGAAGVLKMMATNVPSVATVSGRGGMWSRYETDFASWADKHWRTDSTSSDANFYDRAMIYYVWWARTGDAKYLDRAHKLATLDGRRYIEQTNFMPQPFLLMMDGVALHALLTGDQRSVTAVLRTADFYAEQGGNWHLGIDTTGGSWDNRTQARILSTLLDAWYLGVPSPRGYDYGVVLRDYLTRILSTQSADGAYRFQGQCYLTKSYMTGMVNDALIRYYDTFEADSRIPGAVKRAIDYLWTKSWVPSAAAFRYMESPCSITGSGGSNNPYADLNNMIVSGFGFVARTTGDASYVTKGDQVFSGGVSGAYLAGPKQFNQEYTSSYRYVGMRF